jgi:cytochrome c biogenesis protein CcmG/thiol:disulfide interchange protein DsbE
MIRHLLPLGLFLATAALLWQPLGRAPSGLPSPLVDRPMPAFSLAPLPGADADMAQASASAQAFSPAQLKGRVWMLNVWASWCASCRDEHPLLVDLSRTRSAAIVGLNYQDDPQRGLAWLARHGNPYQATAQDIDGRVGMDLGVYGVPETFVIDKQGRIRLRHAGPITPEVLQQTLLPLLDSLERG